MTPEKRALVDEIKRVCKKNYERGGDVIIECLSDEEIEDQFDSVAAAKKYCGMHIEAALDARWGEDDDPELTVAEKYDKEWEDS